MAKLTQAEVKAKADEYAATMIKIAKAEQAERDELAPLTEEYDRQCEPVRTKHSKKLGSLREQAAGLQAEVVGWLTAAGKPIVLEGEKAVAANELVVGKRTIGVQKFFDRVKDKNAAFWDCVSVGIAKAEKLIGAAAVDEISAKESKLVASIKLK